MPWGISFSKQRAFMPTRSLIDVHQNLITPPSKASVSRKCSKAGNCETGRCGCSKWRYGCSSTCGCKGKCGNPLNDEFILEVFKESNSEKTKRRDLKPTDCFIQWFSRTRKTHPERVTLDWIFETIHLGLRNRMWELEYFQDKLQDWVKRWDETMAETTTPDRAVTQDVEARTGSSWMRISYVYAILLVVQGALGGTLG